MRLTTLAVATALLTCAPALAQSPSGNVAQPERAVPQAGNTTRGPIDNPSTRDAAPASGMAPTAPGREMSSPDKGGNADQNNQPTTNKGGTSGGPAR